MLPSCLRLCLYSLRVMPRRVNVHSGSVLGSTACASCEANNAEIEPHNLFRFNTVLRKHRNQTNNTKLLTVYAVKARHVSDAQFWIQLFVVLIFTVFATCTSQRRVGGISSLICMPCFLICDASQSFSCGTWIHCNFQSHCTGE